MTIQPVNYPSPPEPQRETTTKTIDDWTEILAPAAQLAKWIARTEFVPKGLQGSTEKTLAAIMYGREIGLAPMTGLASIHVINGKPGLSAEMMRSLIFTAGHHLKIRKQDADRCVIEAKRRDDDEWSTFSYTMAEAIRAGDAKNPNYKTRPTEMLLARATTRCARALFPDVIHGLASMEELATLEAHDTIEHAVALTPTTETNCTTQPRTIGRATTKPPAPSTQEGKKKPLPKPATTTPTAEPPAETTIVETLIDENGVVVELTEADSEAERKACEQEILDYFQNLNLNTRQQRLDYAKQATGRTDINTVNDLTLAELQKLLNYLKTQTPPQEESKDNN